MAGNVPVRHYKTSELISKFSSLAQTSQYYVLIAAGSTKSGRPAGELGFSFNDRFVSEDLGMYCNEAVLPGNSFATTEMNSDLPGVSQKFPYRKIYNDLQLTFYVDSSYNVIKFFESWMSYIASPYGYGKAINEDSGQNGSFRFNYPENYKCNLYVAKFNKGSSLNNKIAYRFINAFPIDITSMPISYDSSDVLKCSVSFSYDRYVFDASGKMVESIIELPPPKPGSTLSDVPVLPPEGTLSRTGGTYVEGLYSSEKVSTGFFGGVEKLERRGATIQPGESGVA